MVSPSVDLEDQTTIDDEIDPPHATDQHLALDEDAEHMQPQSDQGLEPAIGIGTPDVDQPPCIGRKCLADSHSCGRGEQSILPCRLERREECLVAAAPMEVNQGGFDVDESETRCASEVVGDTLAPDVRVNASSPSYPDVKGRVVTEDPYSVQPQCCTARERTPV